MSKKAICISVAAVLGAIFAAPSAQALPAAAVGDLGTPVTVRADIDGDGRRDKISLRHVSTRGWRDNFRLSVTTARGKTAALSISRDNSVGVLTPKDMFRGVAPVDGVSGSEIVLLEWDGGEAGGDITYTWRSGKLTRLHAPAGRKQWSTGIPELGWVHGQTVATRNKARVVTIHDLRKSESANTWTGTSIAYTWRGSRWVKGATTVRRGLSDKQAYALNGWIGIEGIK